MSLDVYDQYISDASSWVKSVAFWRAVLYCFAMCRRLEPDYVHFHERENWGNPALLRQAQEVIYRWLVSGQFEEESARMLLTAIEPNIPDTEAFDDCSSALDAISVHVYTVEAIQTRSHKQIGFVYTIAYDRVDAAAGDAVLPEGGVNTPEAEHAIGQHPYVANELSWQRTVFASLLHGPERNEPAILQWLSTLPEGEQ
jgi:uncharacterized protein YjaG (DUF416 family)